MDRNHLESEHAAQQQVPLTPDAAFGQPTVDRDQKRGFLEAPGQVPTLFSVTAYSMITSATISAMTSAGENRDVHGYLPAGAPGVEATMSELDRLKGVKKLRVRGFGPRGSSPS